MQCIHIMRRYESGRQSAAEGWPACVCIFIKLTNSFLNFGTKFEREIWGRDEIFAQLAGAFSAELINLGIGWRHLLWS